MRLDIKPLSVNEVWQGKRFKTDKYKVYEKEVMLMLKPYEIPEGDLILILEFGFATKSSDIDNPVKCFTDILSKYYGFNDNRIVELHVRKIKAGKGKQFIKFEILSEADIDEKE